MCPAGRSTKVGHGLRTAAPSRPRWPRPSGSSSGQGTLVTSEPESSRGSRWPRLTISTRPEPGTCWSMTAVTNSSSSSRSAASRMTVRSSCSASSARSAVSWAAARNAPRTSATVRTASRPLPRTSPSRTRAPKRVSQTAYRSPPIADSAWAARYTPATRNPPARSGTGRSTARCRVSATVRARFRLPSCRTRCQARAVPIAPESRVATYTQTWCCSPRWPARSASASWRPMAPAVDNMATTGP